MINQTSINSRTEVQTGLKSGEQETKDLGQKRRSTKLQNCVSFFFLNRGFRFNGLTQLNLSTDWHFLY